MKPQQNIRKWAVTSLMLTASILVAFPQALDKARAQAGRINCVNNLKQVGVAFRIWSRAHGYEFPFNVPAKYGGSLESCTNAVDGFDQNSWRHFQVMASELKTPTILICPADSAKKPASDFKTLGSSNVTYQIRSGTNINETHPQEVLVRCPTHNIEVLCDGSVHQRPKE